MRVDQLVPYGYTDTAISTFHAFGDRLVREFALELGLPPDVRVLSRPETVVFLRERLFELELDEYRPLGDPTRFLDALATLFSRAKDEDVSPEAYLAHAGRLAAQAAEQTAAADAAGEAGDGGGSRGRGRPGGGRPPAGRARARLCPVPGAPGVERADRLRRPGVARAPAAARVAGRSRGRAAPVQVRARGRVPGHQPRPGRAGRAGRRAAPQRDRGGRRRPVDLQVPRRRDQQHPRVPRALPPGPGRRAPAELPVAGADPRGRLPPRPPQRPGPAGGQGGDREAARPGAGRRRRGARPPRGVRDGRRGGRLDRGGHRAPSPRGRPAARRRGARADERGSRPLPALAQPRGHPVALLGNQRAVRPARGPAAARVPARDRGPGLVSRRLCAGGLGPLRPGRGGPGRDRQHGSPAEPLDLGRPRRAPAAARHPPALPGDPRRGVAAGRRPAALRRARQRAPGGRGAVRVPARLGLAGAGSRRPTRSRPRRRCRTSPASSTSSGPSRRCSRTTGPCSSRVTSTR